MLPAVSVMLGVGAAMFAVFVNRDDNSANASSPAPLSQVQASCGDWMTSSRADGQSDDQWCTDMFAWMGDQSGGSMMHSSMWQSPARMGDSCRDWVDREGAGRTSSNRARCIDMVEWMDAHLSSRRGTWMMQDR
jgi:hypothetical protein